MDERKGYVQLIFYSILAGSVGIFVRLTENMGSFSIVFFRASIATVFIFLAIISLKKLKEIKLTDPGKTLLVGLFQGLAILLYFSALLRTNVSNAVFLMYTAPIFSVIMSKFLLKEKIEKETLIEIFITMSGILLILDPRTFSLKSSETIGNLMALASGFFYAAMAVISKPVLKKKSGYYVAFWQYLIISFMFIVFLDFGSFSAAFNNWWQLGLIGVVSTGVAFILFMEGVKKVEAQKIFIVTSLEPLTGTVLAIIVLSEVPTFLTVVGGTFILYGVYRVTRRSPLERF